jgi:tRNA threonylcarbamoyladenosine biosynthesis protein TsaB
MKLLAFDTATEACSAALWLDGRVLERFQPGIRHAEQLLPMIDDLLNEAGVSLGQLDGIAFGRGPGSFTGLRIGAGVAQGLAFGADLPVIPVSSLAALAQQGDAPKVIAAFDARMQQIYVGRYVRTNAGLVELQGAELVVAPDQAPLPDDDGWLGVGSGWDAYAEAMTTRFRPVLSHRVSGASPHAVDVARLASVGRPVAPELALPTYIRDDVAVKKSI